MDSSLSGATETALTGRINPFREEDPEQIIPWKKKGAIDMSDLKIKKVIGREILDSKRH